MSELPIAHWTELARRDDWDRHFVGSDIRQMLDRITRLEADRVELIELVERAISYIEDAEKDTNWGNPTFGPSPSEEISETLDRIKEK